jgi:hypothetical protein
MGPHLCCHGLVRERLSPNPPLFSR